MSDYVNFLDACQDGNLQALRTSIDAIMNSGLLYAAANGRLDIVEYLVEEKNVDVHTSNNYAVRYAAENGHLAVVKCLTKKGANIFSKNDYAIKHASKNGHLDVVKYLVEECGADIHAGYGDALCYACKKGHLDVVKYLVEMGADIHPANEGDERPLRNACEGGHLDVVKYLHNKGANIQSVVTLAVVDGQLEIVKYLTEQKADMKSIVFKACKYGQLELIKYFEQQGVGIDCELGKPDGLQRVLRKFYVDMTDNPRTNSNVLFYFYYKLSLKFQSELNLLDCNHCKKCRRCKRCKNCMGDMRCPSCLYCKGSCTEHCQVKNLRRDQYQLRLYLTIFRFFNQDQFITVMSSFAKGSVQCPNYDVGNDPLFDGRNLSMVVCSYLS